MYCSTLGCRLFPVLPACNPPPGAASPGPEGVGDEVLDLSPFVDRRDYAGAGAGERAGTLDDLLQHGGHVQALADAEDGCAQPRDAVAGGPRRVSIVQCSTPAEG